MSYPDVMRAREAGLRVIPAEDHALPAPLAVPAGIGRDRGARAVAEHVMCTPEARNVGVSLVDVASGRVVFVL